MGQKRRNASNLVKGNQHPVAELMDHSFCVGSYLYGLFKILFDLIQCWLWIGCGLVFQMGFPYIPDNAVQIIMKDMEIFIDRIADMRVNQMNLILEATRQTILKEHTPGENDLYMRTLELGQVQENDFYSHILHDDLDSIVRDIREAAKNLDESPVHKAGGC